MKLADKAVIKSGMALFNAPDTILLLSSLFKDEYVYGIDGFFIFDNYIQPSQDNSLYSKNDSRIYEFQGTSIHEKMISFIKQKSHEKKLLFRIDVGCGTITPENIIKIDV
jgi:hypothetical protein